VIEKQRWFPTTYFPFNVALRVLRHKYCHPHNFISGCFVKNINLTAHLAALRLNITLLAQENVTEYGN